MLEKYGTTYATTKAGYKTSVDILTKPLLEKIQTEDLSPYNKSLTSLEEKITTFKSEIKNRKIDIADSKNSINLPKSDKDPSGYDLSRLDDILKNIDSLQASINDLTPDAGKFNDAFQLLQKSLEPVFSPVRSQVDIINQGFLKKYYLSKQTLLSNINEISHDVSVYFSDRIYDNKEKILNMLMNSNYERDLSAPFADWGTTGPFLGTLTQYEQDLKDGNYPIDQTANFDNVRYAARELFDWALDTSPTKDGKKEYKALIDALNKLPAGFSFQDSNVKQTKNSVSKLIGNMKTSLSTIHDLFTKYATLTLKPLAGQETATKERLDALRKDLSNALISYSDLTSQFKDTILDLKSGIVNRTNEDIASILKTNNINLTKTNDSIGYDLSPLDSLVKEANNMQGGLDLILDDINGANKLFSPFEVLLLDKEHYNVNLLTFETLVRKIIK